MRRLGIIIAIAAGLLAGMVCWTRRGMRWGATTEEIEATVTGGDWLEGLHGRRIRMTRAIAIDAPPEEVWPWVAQLGRGAGWYSYERIDNGGRLSARHIVGWIPEPAVGDAAAIGYLRHVDPGRELVWWAPNAPFLRARTWSTFGYLVGGAGEGSRLQLRVDAVARGLTGPLVVTLFPLVDSVMAVRQLRNLKDRVERYGTRTSDPDDPETGEPDQYQLYHVIYASGSEAGVTGSEGARGSRESAHADGVI